MLQNLFLAFPFMAAASVAGAQHSVVASPDAPRAIGPYVQAVAVGDTLYLSGQLPLDPKSGELVGDDIRVQTEQVLLNLKAVLAAHGMSLDDAVMANVFLTQLSDFPSMNEVYAGFFKSPPARATVEVKGLAKGARIEISLIAVRRR